MRELESRSLDPIPGHHLSVCVVTPPLKCEPEHERTQISRLSIHRGTTVHGHHNVPAVRHESSPALMRCTFLEYLGLCHRVFFLWFYRSFITILVITASFFTAFSPFFGAFSSTTIRSTSVFVIHPFHERTPMFL